MLIHKAESVVLEGSTLSVSPVQVVKAFIVLSPAYSSHDPEALTRELQEHVKRVTAPYKYPRKVSVGDSGGSRWVHASWAAPEGQVPAQYWGDGSPHLPSCCFSLVCLSLH